MKYITNIQDGKNVKHIVEVNGKNVEVIQRHDREDYGNLKGEQVFTANGIKVSKDFRFINNSCGSSYDYVHLAQVVLAIELTRFVISNL